MCSEPSSARLGVIGAGAWGTVLSLLLARNGHRVTLWARRESHARQIAAERENQRRLPGVAIPKEVGVTSDLAAACEADAIFLAVPSTAFGPIADRLPRDASVVSCSKGFAGPGLVRLSEALSRGAPERRVAVLSGPNLASEIAAGLPAAAVAASHDEELAGRVQAWLQSSGFRVYTSPDPIGAEVGGALKNVIALAAGMSDGLGLGDNAKATIVTRGLVEIVRLAETLGARSETVYGLAGLGDMIATCSSRGSRNHLAGERIAAGATVEELQEQGLTAEGIPTVGVVHAFAREKSLSLPICSEVYEVAFERKEPSAAIRDLMARARKSEW